MIIRHVGCRDGYAATAPVGSFRPNAFGLYDMLGNVDEFVEDCWNRTYRGAPTDARAWTNGEDGCHYRVVRGGHWGLSGSAMRPAFRTQSQHAYRGRMSGGFRLARNLD